MTKVKEIMKDDVKSVSPSDTIAEVAQKMTDSTLQVLPVCKNGRFSGIITESDIVSNFVAKDHDPRHERADSLVINHVPKVSAGSDIVDAAKIMANHGICYLPVVNNGGKFAGLLTIDDLVKESLILASLVLTGLKKDG